MKDLKNKFKNNVILDDNEINKLLDYYVESSLIIIEKDLNEDLTNNSLTNKYV